MQKKKKKILGAIVPNFQGSTFCIVRLPHPNRRMGPTNAYRSNPYIGGRGCGFAHPPFCYKSPHQFFFPSYNFNLNPFYLSIKHPFSIFWLFFSLYQFSSKVFYVQILMWYTGTTCNKYFIMCTTMFTTLDLYFVTCIYMFTFYRVQWNHHVIWVDSS